VSTVLAVLLAAALSNGLAGAEPETPTIKDIMGKLHKGAKSPLVQLKTQLKTEDPNWEQIQKETKDFVILGASLAKNDPPKGDTSAYKSLAANYFEQSKVLDDAAQKKDLAATKKAFSKLSSSCKACHSAHKGQ
jgi:cytochrome c556